MKGDTSTKGQTQKYQLCWVEVMVSMCKGNRLRSRTAILNGEHNTFGGEIRQRKVKVKLISGKNTKNESWEEKYIEE